MDFLLPEVTPPEGALYLYLIRHSLLKNGGLSARFGKRTLAAGHGIGSRGGKTTFETITKLLKGLEEKGCIKIGATTREGTEYFILLPKDIPLVSEKIASLKPESQEEDYFTDPKKRKIIFEKDKWICQYCGEKVTEKNVTLDHYIPQSKGGKHNKENLRTCCLVCNGIKSGKTYEEAAPFILKSIQERKQRTNT